jgi:hypothetical protein
MWPPGASASYGFRAIPAPPHLVGLGELACVRDGLLALSSFLGLTRRPGVPIPAMNHQRLGQSVGVEFLSGAGWCPDAR